MPNRIIKESIRTSEKINSLSDFEYRLYISLITFVDDFGRGDARPAVIKGACLPMVKGATLGKIEKALKALAEKDCIQLYHSDGKDYFHFPRWAKHQTIRNKKSKFPDPEKCTKKQLQVIDFNCEQL